MRKVRVLIVDDSAAIRRLLADILSADADIEVVGTASTGLIALDKVQQQDPDVLTLDVEMPDMDGLTLLTRLRGTSPRLPVIMFSSLTERAGVTTLEALSRGAVDYVTKPSGTGSLEASLHNVREQLLPKVKLFGRRRIDAERMVEPRKSARADAAGEPRPPARPAAAAGAGTPQRNVGIIAIGSSTGGPNALTTFFEHVPAGLSVPIVIVQHMPPLFTKLLAERLSAGSAMPFREAVGGELLEPGIGYIAPGNFHLRVVADGTRYRCALDQAPPENSCRPAVDVLFRSVAATHGAATLAVVLTGMGQDGLRGAGDIVARGGRVLAQDEATSVVWGMPGAVTRAGLADAVLPLAELPAAVLRRLQAVERPARAMAG